MGGRANGDQGRLSRCWPLVAQLAADPEVNAADLRERLAAHGDKVPVSTARRWLAKARAGDPPAIVQQPPALAERIEGKLREVTAGRRLAGRLAPFLDEVLSSIRDLRALGADTKLAADVRVTATLGAGELGLSVLDTLADRYGAERET